MLRGLGVTLIAVCVLTGSNATAGPEQARVLRQEPHGGALGGPFSERRAIHEAAAGKYFRQAQRVDVTAVTDASKWLQEYMATKHALPIRARKHLAGITTEYAASLAELQERSIEGVEEPTARYAVLDKLGSMLGKFEVKSYRFPDAYEKRTIADWYTAMGMPPRPELTTFFYVQRTFPGEEGKAAIAKELPGWTFGPKIWKLPMVWTAVIEEAAPGCHAPMAARLRAAAALKADGERAKAVLRVVEDLIEEMGKQVPARFTGVQGRQPCGDR